MKILTRCKVRIVVQHDILFPCSYRRFSLTCFPDRRIDIHVSYCCTFRGYIEAHLRGCEPLLGQGNAASREVNIPSVRRACNQDKNAVWTPGNSKANVLRDEADNARNKRTNKPKNSYRDSSKNGNDIVLSKHYIRNSLILYVKKSRGWLHDVHSSHMRHICLRNIFLDMRIRYKTTPLSKLHYILFSIFPQSFLYSLFFINSYASTFYSWHTKIFFLILNTILIKIFKVQTWKFWIIFL